MNIGILPGRFNFLHNGHFELIKWAVKSVDLLVLCIGTVAIAPDSRNPFNSLERVDQIKTLFPDANIVFEFIHDHPDSNEDWANEVQLKVTQHKTSPTDTFTLLGNCKSDTEWYLNLLGNHLVAELKVFAEDGNQLIDVCASEVRKLAYTGDEAWKGLVPEALVSAYEKWLETDAGKSRSAEFCSEEKYKEPYKNLPYPPIFHAVDALVMCQGHVLVVKRGSLRGKGLFAMPGGFLNVNERLFDGAVRELQEETAISVDTDTIKNSWTGISMTLDNPNRSLIGRIVSEVFLFSLPHDVCGGKLPVVKGSDDAAEAMWIPVEHFKGNYYRDMDVLRTKWFEDHLYGIKSLLSDIEACK